MIKKPDTKCLEVVARAVRAAQHAPTKWRVGRQRVAQLAACLEAPDLLGVMCEGGVLDLHGDLSSDCGMTCFTKSR